MIRTQIQLTKEQHRRLRRIARERGVSLAELVRRCIDRAIGEEATDRASLYARAWQVVGSFHDREGATDVSERHDDYLEDAFS
jgi:hypothetical protein